MSLERTFSSDPAKRIKRKLSLDVSIFPVPVMEPNVATTSAAAIEIHKNQEVAEKGKQDESETGGDNDVPECKQEELMALLTAYYYFCLAQSANMTLKKNKSEERIISFEVNRAKDKQRMIRFIERIGLGPMVKDVSIVSHYTFAEWQLLIRSRLKRALAQKLLPSQ